MFDVIIIGAGLSGLAAARTLAAQGRSVKVLDKGRGVGGRLATRRIGDARLDHGAQFFTVRGESFGSLVEQAVADGVVREWNRGFGDDGDGHPRYTGDEGMTSLAKWMATGLDVETSVRVEQLTSGPAGWAVEAEGGATFEGRAVLATAPVPQTRDLLAASNVTLEAATDDVLAAISYHPVIGLLAVLDRPATVHPSGGEQLCEGVFSFVGDNQSKGISAVPAVTFHANHAWSANRFEDTDMAGVHADLLEHAKPWIRDASVLESQLKKWRYAGPVTVRPEPALATDVDGNRLVLAGDAFAGPKVEGAFNSGLAAAEILSSD